jgi:hypothetical protein
MLIKSLYGKCQLNRIFADKGLLVGLIQNSALPTKINEE